MQTTRRVGVLVTLFERYDPKKAFQKKFWVPVTWEKNFRDQQSQRSNLPKLSFWTDFDWNGLIFGPKTQKPLLDHVLDSKMQITRRVGVLVTLFEKYDPNKAFQKKFWAPVTWEKILETSKVREAISQNSIFELILTEPGWFSVPRLKIHY